MLLLNVCRLFVLYVGRDLLRAVYIVSHDLLRTMQEADKADLVRLLRLNSPEWVSVSVGVLAAVVSGFVQPAFALVLSEMLAVRNVLYHSCNLHLTILHFLTSEDKTHKNAFVSQKVQHSQV